MRHEEANTRRLRIGADEYAATTIAREYPFSEIKVVNGRRGVRAESRELAAEILTRYEDVYMEYLIKTVNRIRA